MRKLIIIMLLFAALLQACGHGEQSAGESSVSEPDTLASRSALNNEEMVQIDSSEYVMFLLPLPTYKKNESSVFSGLEKKIDALNYWNIAFYNTLSHTRHLLTDEQMIITSYGGSGVSGPADADIVPNPPRMLANSLLFYKVISSDYDKDGKLTDNDPVYLFESNLAGENFKQISPDNVSIISWHLIKKTGMLLMDGRTDTNHDNKFTSDDKVNTYLFDLNTGKPAEPVFTEKFNDDTYKLMKQLWPPEKQK